MQINWGRDPSKWLFNRRNGGRPQNPRWRAPQQAWKVLENDSQELLKSGMDIPMSMDREARNRWGYARMRLNGPVDMKALEKKFWRQKQSEPQSSDQVYPKKIHTTVVSLLVDGKA